MGRKTRAGLGMLEYPLHDSFREYIKALNNIYLKYNALHYDYDPTNFKWEDCNSEERCVYAIRRKSKDGDILAVMNFSDWVQFDYSVTIGEDFSAELLLDSDNQLYSGKLRRQDKIQSEWRKTRHGYPAVQRKNVPAQTRDRLSKINRGNFALRSCFLRNGVL